MRTVLAREHAADPARLGVVDVVEQIPRGQGVVRGLAIWSRAIIE